MNQDDIRIINTLKRFKIYGLTRRALKVKDKGILNAFQQENNNEKSIEFEISKKDLFVFYNNDVELKELQKSSIVKLKEKYKFNIKYIKVVKHYTNNCNNQISICDLISQFKYKAFIYYCKKAKFDTSLVYNCILCNNYDELETKLNSPLSLKLFANYCNVNNVSVRTSTFYDFKGKNYYSGGAERYLIDLHEILSKRGINMDVYQDADIPFFRKYRDLNIIGLPLKNQPMRNLPCRAMQFFRR